MNKIERAMYGETNKSPQEPIVHMVQRAMYEFSRLMDQRPSVDFVEPNSINQETRNAYNTLGSMLHRFIDQYNREMNDLVEIRNEVANLHRQGQYDNIKLDRNKDRLDSLEDEVIRLTVELDRVSSESNQTFLRLSDEKREHSGTLRQAEQLVIALDKSHTTNQELLATCQRLEADNNSLRTPTEPVKPTPDELLGLMRTFETLPQAQQDAIRQRVEGLAGITPSTLTAREVTKEQYDKTAEEYNPTPPPQPVVHWVGDARVGQLIPGHGQSIEILTETPGNESGIPTWLTKVDPDYGNPICFAHMRDALREVDSINKANRAK